MWFSNCKRSLLLEGVEESKFYVILLQEVPENASNVVLKLQMLPTLGGGQNPLPDPPPLGRSAPSPLKPRSVALSLYIIYFSPCHIVPPPPPRKKFLDPPLISIPLELRGLRPLTPAGALPQDSTLKNVEWGLHVRVG